MRETQDIEFNVLCMKYDHLKIAQPAEGFTASNYEFNAEATWLLCSYINTVMWTFRRAYAYIRVFYSAKHRIQLSADITAGNIENLVQRYSFASQGDNIGASSRSGDLLQDKRAEILPKIARSRSSSDRQNGDQMKQKRMLVDIAEMGILLEQTVASFYLDGSEALQVANEYTLKKCLEGRKLTLS